MGFSQFFLFSFTRTLSKQDSNPDASPRPAQRLHSRQTPTHGHWVLMSVQQEGSRPGSGHQRKTHSLAFHPGVLIRTTMSQDDLWTNVKGTCGFTSHVFLFLRGSFLKDFSAGRFITCHDLGIICWTVLLFFLIPETKESRSFGLKRRRLHCNHFHPVNTTCSNTRVIPVTNWETLFSWT